MTHTATHKDLWLLISYDSVCFLSNLLICFPASTVSASAPWNLTLFFNRQNYLTLTPEMRKDQWSELTEGKGQRVGWIPNNPNGNGLQTRQIPAKREPNSLVNQLYLGKELFLPLSLLINQGYPNECTVIWGWTGTSPPPPTSLKAMERWLQSMACLPRVANQFDRRVEPGFSNLHCCIFCSYCCNHCWHWMAAPRSRLLLAEASTLQRRNYSFASLWQRWHSINAAQLACSVLLFACTWQCLCSLSSSHG